MACAPMRPPGYRSALIGQPLFISLALLAPSYFPLIDTFAYKKHPPLDSIHFSPVMYDYYYYYYYYPRDVRAFNLEIAKNSFVRIENWIGLYCNEW